MFTNFRFKAAAIIASLAAFSHIVQAGTSAWHIDYIKPLIVARLDPIVAPDQVSGHAHTIYGGSNFAGQYSYDHSVASNCSSIFAQYDKGNYWAPNLYATEDDANSPTNKYTAVRSDQRYYLFLDRANDTEPVMAPPKGLRFIVGNMSAKSYEDTGLPLEALIYTCQTAGAPVSQNVLSDNFNFDRHCPELKVELRAPSCWDGHNLYLKNNSHMAYPLQTLYGPCPYDHPYRIPAIQFEWTHKVGEVLPAGKSFKDHLIWSSGETTGYGFHADFTMGWDRDVLTKALNDPACLLGKSIPAEECPSLGINKEVDIAKARACKPAHGYVEEAGTTFGETVDRLPGCNLPWKSGPKPTCSQQSPDPNIQSFIGITADSVAVPVDREVKPAGAPKDVWERVGCLDEYVLDLGNKTGWHDYNSMTNERCHDFCAEIGAPYAGTYQGSRCRCALTMNTASYLLDDKKCAEKCSGDSSNCGGMGYNLYHNSFVAIQGPKQPKESDKSYRGCFTDGSIVGQRSPAHENVDTCRAHCKGFKYYGIAAGKYCDCSNEILAPQGIETRVPDYLCSSPCDTKPEQMCGGEPYGTFYQSVYIVDGTFQPKPAANVASTGFSSVPTTSGGSVETGPAVVGNGVLLAVATTSSASVATSTTRNVATPKLPGVNNMAIDLKDELGSKAGSVIAQSTDAPTRASSSHRQHHHTPCAVVTKTVTVTATVKASDAGKRHVQRRSRQHMFDFLS